MDRIQEKVAMLPFIPNERVEAFKNLIPIWFDKDRLHPVNEMLCDAARTHKSRRIRETLKRYYLHGPDWIRPLNNEKRMVYYMTIPCFRDVMTSYGKDVKLFREFFTFVDSELDATRFI